MEIDGKLLSYTRCEPSSHPSFMVLLFMEKKKEVQKCDVFLGQQHPPSASSGAGLVLSPERGQSHIPGTGQGIEPWGVTGTG